VLVKVLDSIIESITYLLSDHDSPRGERSATNTGNSKQLNEASEIVTATNDSGFLDKLSMDIVEITGRLEWSVAEAKERAIGLGISSLFHKPSYSVLIKGIRSIRRWQPHLEIRDRSRFQ